MFLTFKKPANEVFGTYSLREIRSGIGAFLRHEQMLCLQNYENLAIIVSKALGGSDEKSNKGNVKASGSLADLENLVALANG